MEGKRLDLDAPLISFRRITTASLLPEDVALQSLRQALRNGRGKDCGAVPFFWEKTPGQPKDNPSNESFCGGAAIRSREPPKPLLGRILKGSRGELMKNDSSDGVTEKSLVRGVESSPANRGNGGTAFSDLQDSLSCNESFSTKKRLPSLCADPSFRDSSSNFSKDPITEEFMMGLFLPAAEAMASESLRQSWKKPPRAPEFAEKSGTQDVSRRWVNVASPRDNGWNEKDEEEEEDDESVNYEDKGYFSSKTCGLFPKFCLKNSFCFLNHVPGMKFPDLTPTRPCLKPSPGMKILHHERVSKDLWGAGFRHRSVNEDYIEEDNGIELTSISNQLTYWSNSQPLDGSSFPHSSATALSPNKNDDLKTKSRSSKIGDLDSSEEDSESYWDVASSNCWIQGSGSTSPATYRNLCMQPSQMADTSGSNSSTVNMTTGTKETIDSTANDYTDPDFSFCTRRLNCDEKMGKDSRNCKINHKDLELIRGCRKDENSLALSLLPPPLPKSPSDSWLLRTLPGISAKGPYQQSFLGIQFQSRNRALQVSRGDQKLQEKFSKKCTLTVKD